MTVAPSTDSGHSASIPDRPQTAAFTRRCIGRLPLDHEIRVSADAITLTARRRVNPEPGVILAAVIARR